MVTPTAQARQVAAILTPEAHEAVTTIGQTTGQKLAQVARDLMDDGLAIRDAESDRALAQAINRALLHNDEAVMKNFLSLINDYVEMVARRRPEVATFIADEAGILLRQRAAEIADALGSTVPDVRADLAARAAASGA